MICPKCNAEVPENSKFCSVCGEVLPVAEPCNDDLSFETVILNPEEQTVPSETVEKEPIPAEEPIVQESAPIQEPISQAPVFTQAPNPSTPCFANQPYQNTFVNPQYPPQSSYNPSYQNNVPLNYRKEITEENLPEEYKPLGAWKYFWLQILFAIPIVGFIFLIIFSFNGSNINRRNFARSYWCFLMIGAIIFAVMLILLLVLGFTVSDVFDEVIYYSLGN